MRGESRRLAVDGGRGSRRGSQNGRDWVAGLSPDVTDDFIRAACVPLEAHAAGTLAQAEAIRSARPDVTGASVAAAAVVGHATAIRRFIEADAAAVTAKTGPYGWDPLTYLCFSTYLKLDRSKTGDFGDGYFGMSRDSTALHVAAWRARHSTVRLLVSRGADPSACDGSGHTPLARAVEACVNSHWTHLRSPASVATLLAAGASADRVRFPTGYDEIDRLLAGRCSTTT